MNDKNNKQIGIILTGSKDYNNRKKILEEIEVVVQRETQRATISGDDLGIVLLTDGNSPTLETFAESLASENSKRWSHFRVKALWDKYGKKAGYWRDKKLCELANYCLIFREGSKDELSTAPYRFLIPLARKERIVIKDFPTSIPTLKKCISPKP